MEKLPFLGTDLSDLTAIFYIYMILSIIRCGHCSHCCLLRSQLPACCPGPAATLPHKLSATHRLCDSPPYQWPRGGQPHLHEDHDDSPGGAAAPAYMRSQRSRGVQHSSGLRSQRRLRRWAVPVPSTMDRRRRVPHLCIPPDRDHGSIPTEPAHVGQRPQHHQLGRVNRA